MVRLAGLAVVGVLAVASAGRAGPAAEFEKAFLVAQKQVPGGEFVRARTEGTAPTDVVGFFFLLRGEVVEIEVNRAGAVVKRATPERDVVRPEVLQRLSRSKPAARLPVGKLLAAADKALGGAPVTDVKYDVTDDRLVVVVNDKTFDAATGEAVGGR